MMNMSDNLLWTVPTLVKVASTLINLFFFKLLANTDGLGVSYCDFRHFR